MNKKRLFVLVIVYVFFYLLNYISPMAFGDDYLYSFIWQGKPMYEPLSENAIRIASWHDLFISQWSHYFTWSGRTVNHTIAQFFLWMGKDIFNVFNAFISVLLIVEIYFAIHKGEINLNFKIKEIFMIFFALWTFTPSYVSVFCWLDGACNYLWTNTIILGFLIPYIHRYFHANRINNHKYLLSLIMFLWGCIAGWTNENSVCWIILCLSLFIFKLRKNREIDTWLYTGLLGLTMGYCLLMFSPGNTARLYAEHGKSGWLDATLLKANIEMMFAVFFMYQIFLWYFNLRSLITLKKIGIENESIGKEITLAKLACVVSFCMTGIMFFSPFFPPRSAFAGTIFLIVASGILANIQVHYKIGLIQDSAKKFLSYLAVIYFIMTSTVTLYHTQLINGQMLALIAEAKDAGNKKSQEILIVEPFRETKKIEALMSGFHIPGFELSDNENHWTNVAFSQYYGIKGIRMVGKSNDADKDKQN